MGIIFQCIGYLLIGFLQEVMVIVYQRATSTDRKLLAASMTMALTAVSLLIIAQITHQIIASGIFSILFVLVYALGKGIGAYATLSWWGRFGVIHDSTGKQDGNH